MEKIKELLGEDLFNQVKEKLGDKKLMVDDGNFIPKSRFDEVNEQKKEYKSMLDDRASQLEDLKEKAKGNEELEEKIKELEETNQSKIEEYENKIKQINFDRKLEKAISSVKGKNPRAIKALLDIDKIQVDDDKLIGFEEQIKQLQESDSYLFGDDTLGGREPNPSKEPPKTQIENPWETGKVNLTKQAELLESDPKLAKQLIEKAGYNPANYGI